MKRIFWALLFCAFSAHAEVTPVDSQLLAIDSAFVEGKYSQVELLTLRLLQSGAELSTQERSRVNLAAAYSLIMLNREPEAREYFRGALAAEPDLTLDPVQVSPKFRVVFDEVKAEFQRTQAASLREEKRAEIANRFPSQSAVLSNLIVPGSGQWRDGRKLRGAAFFLAQAATAGVLVWRIQEMSDSRADYLAQTDPSRIEETYDIYNSDHTLAWGAGILTAVVYLAAQADLILFRPNESPVRLATSLQSGMRIGMTIRW